MITVNMSNEFESLISSATEYNRDRLLSVIEHLYPECDCISIYTQFETRVYISVFERGIVCIDELHFLSIDHLIKDTADHYTLINKERDLFSCGVAAENLVKEIQEMLDINLVNL